MKARVSYIFPVSHHFRYPFHVKLRSILALHDVDYSVTYCAPYGANLQKKDTVDIAWGHEVPLLRMGSGGPQLQWALGDVLRSDLVIVQQENRLLLNYFCQILGMLGLKRVAFFGHGRNFQAADSNSRGERWKRFWAPKVDWWFGYTEETKRFITSLGYPEERFTVFNNAVDTGALAAVAEKATPERLAARRSELGLVGQNICVYVGGLYNEKRVAFLIDALDRIRARVPDFEFVVVGGGVDLGMVQAAAGTRSWLKAVGPRFGEEKAELMSLGKLFLIPGLVGLAVLDAGVLGLPVVTTDFPFHSPEIAYLKDGVNGVIVKPWTDVDSYAGAVVDLLRGDPGHLAEMSRAAKEIGRTYTIDAMAGRFADGVLKALMSKAPRSAG
jgi:glycosyltransferase involved in cell wall biosynthesis